MTWGNKLLLVFIGFALLMSTMVYKCAKQNFELVSKDYYNDELRYQDKIDGVNNANKLSNVEVAQTANEVSIQLPKELNGLASKGQIWFYCANSSLNDRKMPVKANSNGLILINKRKLAKTHYRLKMNWETGTEKFYNEQSLVVK